MPRGQIELLYIERDANTVRFPFRCDASLDRLLWPSRELTIYCSEGVCSDSSELAATFLFAMAPLAWMYGARIKMNFAIPEAARRTLEDLGTYLSAHYSWPQAGMTAGLRTIADSRAPRFHQGLFFSAGVDSSLALSQLGERVDWLIHVSNFENLDSRITPEQRVAALDTTRRIAYERGYGWMHLRTNIAQIFKHNRFDDKFPQDCSFWLGLEHVQHLATAIAAARPRLAGVYLEGGFNELLTAVGSCAASSAFINLYRWRPPFRLLHQDMPRQEKIEYLLDNDPELLKSLRVCFSSGAGTCAACRKCQATMLMVLSAGGHLRGTSFPPAILASLVKTVERLSVLGPEGHAFFNQALAGRMLHGSRVERWAQLLAIIRQEQDTLGAAVCRRRSARRSARSSSS
jgi:hypothetical protein